VKRVIVESPYAGETVRAIKMNEIYAEICLYDCLVNYNESPYASHLLYTRKYVLKDNVPEERKLGIDAGFVWREVADKTVFYVELGISNGMSLGIDDCIKNKIEYEVRSLPDDLWTMFNKICFVNGIGSPKREMVVIKGVI
jgi:hypothetical protein